MMQRREFESLQVNVFLNMLKELGSEVTSDSMVLDFGCGKGWAVYHYRKRDIKVFGVDVLNSYDNIQKLCKDQGIIESILHIIDMNNYKIPFETVANVSMRGRT